MPSLKKRYFRPEIMDDPALESELHYGALDGLGRINVLSRVADPIFQVLADWAKEKRGRLKVLDIATGGGDIPIALAGKAARAGVPLEIAACDKSERALDYARKAAWRRNLRVDFFPLDIFKDDIPRDYDVIISNLFLHHLSILQTQPFLKKISGAAREAILVSDLERSVGGFLLASSVPLFLTRSHVVHEDGVQSVRAAYSLREIKRMAERAGLEGAEIKRVWPFRYQLRWRKS